MAKTNNLHDFLVDLANAIRTKKKYPDSQKINPQDFSDEIDGISGGENLKYVFDGTVTKIELSDLEGLTSLKASAFTGCPLIKTIELPDSITVIGSNAFSSCAALEQLVLPDNLDRIGSTIISDTPSSYLKSLHYLETNDGKYLGSKNNPYLLLVEAKTNLAITNQTKFVYYSSFRSIIGSFTEIIVPDGVHQIDSYAFRDATSAKSVIIPNSVKKIGSYLFNASPKIEEMTIPMTSSEDVHTQGVSAEYYPFGLTYFSSSSYTDSQQCWQHTNKSQRYAYVPKSLKKITFTGKIVTYGAFSFMSLITEFHSSENLKEIEEKAFYKCGSLNVVEFGNVETISDRSFHACNSLETIVLPKSLEKITGYAFESCSKLKSVTFEGIPVSISRAFDSCPALLDIYVPWAQGAVSGAPWGATNATIHYNWTPPSPGGDYAGTYTGGGSYSMRYFKIYDANDSLISSGDVDWEGTVTVPQGGHIVVSANETYGGIYVKVNNLVNCTASEVNSWAETVTITPTADNFSFHCEDDFD